MRRIPAFIVGLAGGALLGAVTAILLTPASGEDLRSDFQQRFNRFREELEAAAEDRRLELERQLETMRRPVREIPLEDR
ncbi:MAG: YtxH domain-containing protein [Anaerolineales bacterium]|nr:YtxH domain-containing protein [Anaerolineales bacterium]